MASTKKRTQLLCAFGKKNWCPTTSDATNHGRTKQLTHQQYHQTHHSSYHPRYNTSNSHPRYSHNQSSTNINAYRNSSNSTTSWDHYSHHNPQHANNYSTNPAHYSSTYGRNINSSSYSAVKEYHAHLACFSFYTTDFFEVPYFSQRFWHPEALEKFREARRLMFQNRTKQTMSTKTNKNTVKVRGTKNNNVVGHPSRAPDGEILNREEKGCEDVAEVLNREENIKKKKSSKVNSNKNSKIPNNTVTKTIEEEATCDISHSLKKTKTSTRNNKRKNKDRAGKVDRRKKILMFSEDNNNSTRINNDEEEFLDEQEELEDDPADTALSRAQKYKARTKKAVMQRVKVLVNNSCQTQQQTSTHAACPTNLNSIDDENASSSRTTEEDPTSLCSTTIYKGP